MESPPDYPRFEFDLLHIKTPQLIGIIAGCIVFSVTISVVIYLLVASGTLKNCIEELQRGDPIKFDFGKKKREIPQYEDLPLLFDHLLEARKKLSKQLSLVELEGKTIKLSLLNAEIINALFEMVNGSPQFDAPQYDPMRIWGWIKVEENQTPWKSIEDFRLYLEEEDRSCLAIIDIEMQKPIGIVVLSQNSVKNLSICISDIMITPAYQGMKKAHEAVLRVLIWLFSLGYRRVTMEVEARNMIGRKFAERCGFGMEGILRKHRIRENRNCDTALYSLLNHEWEEKEIKLKKYLGWEIRPPRVNVFEISYEDLKKPSHGMASSNGTDALHSIASHSSIDGKNEERHDNKYHQNADFKQEFELKQESKALKTKDTEPNCSRDISSESTAGKTNSTTSKKKNKGKKKQK